MENREKLGTYLKELPIDKPSDNFTQLVMNRVRLERNEAKMVYQPLISWQVWWKVIVGAFLLILIITLIVSYFPASPNASDWIFLDKEYLSLLLKPLDMLVLALNKLSFTYVIVPFAITALLFFDQIYSRITDRK